MKLKYGNSASDVGAPKNGVPIWFSPMIEPGEHETDQEVGGERPEERLEVHLLVLEDAGHGGHQDRRQHHGLRPAGDDHGGLVVRQQARDRGAAQADHRDRRQMVEPPQAGRPEGDEQHDDVQQDRDGVDDAAGERRQHEHGDEQPQQQPEAVVWLATRVPGEVADLLSRAADADWCVAVRRARGPLRHPVSCSCSVRLVTGLVRRSRGHGRRRCPGPSAGSP